MGKHKRLPWLLVVLVVLLILLWAKSRTEPEFGLTETMTPTPTPTKSGKSSTGIIKYEDALIMYADRKIQFDASCHGLPGSLVVKTGTKVMIDNRSADKKTMNINGVTYVFSGYTFKILIMSSKILPHTVGVDCKSATGSTENAAIILIEK